MRDLPRTGDPNRDGATDRDHSGEELASYSSSARPLSALVGTPDGYVGVVREVEELRVASQVWPFCSREEVVSADAVRRNQSCPSSSLLESGFARRFWGGRPWLGC